MRDGETRQPRRRPMLLYSTWLDGHDALKRWALAEDHAYVLWLIRYRFALTSCARVRSACWCRTVTCGSNATRSSCSKTSRRASERTSVVANVEGELFPSINGGLVYFRADLPGEGGRYLLEVFNNHVDDLLADESPPECHKERGVGTQVVWGAMMDKIF